MSLLSDYQRHVEKPMIAAYEERIAKLSEALKAKEGDVLALEREVLALRADVDAALGQRDEAVKAAVEGLKPFAEAAAHLDAEVPGLPDHSWLYACDDSLTLGDCRRARSVVADLKRGAE